jgi:hypothetical protein
MTTQLKLGVGLKRLCWAGMLLATPALPANTGEHTSSAIGYEIVGQVFNASPQQSLQYGYLNYVRGLPQVATSDAPISESTALFTFYNDTATERVINNGPIRVIDRTGTGAVYLDAGNASFNNPETFRKGKPIQLYKLRHQVIIDTSTGYFTVVFEMTITSAKTFKIERNAYRLGRPGGVYQLNVAGRLAPVGPPSAHIAGVAIGTEAESVEID